MNCYFCNNKIIDLKVGDLTCSKCPTKVYHYTDWVKRTILAIGMRTTINNKRIEVYIDIGPDHPFTHISEFVPDKETLPGITRLSHHIKIARLPFILNINPHNLNDKLKTIITFS